jgi:hypothetical protein
MVWFFVIVFSFGLELLCPTGLSGRQHKINFQPDGKVFFGRATGQFRKRTRAIS